MLPRTYMYDMLSDGFLTYSRGHTLLHCCKIDENVCFRSISELVKSWKITGFGCFPLFWAVFGHMLPGTYMYDMLSYGLPTYHRGHILLLQHTRSPLIFDMRPTLLGVLCHTEAPREKARATATLGRSQSWKQWKKSVIFCSNRIYAPLRPIVNSGPP